MFRVALLLLTAGCVTEPGNPLVLTNGRIFTVDPARPWAEAIAIEDGAILAVGSEDEVLDKAGGDARIVDLRGRMVMPGFQDPHLHAVEAGINQSLCPLPSEASRSRYLRLLRECAEAFADAPWVVGAGVNMAALLEADPAPVDLLDRAVPDRPALILDDLGHGAWANRRALRAVGYDVSADDPPGGIIDRDPESGRPSGVVFENAQQKLRTAAFPPTPENLDLAYDSLLGALELLARNGITSVSDAGGYWPRGHHEAWLRAEAEATLTVRASNALYVFPDRSFDRQVDELRELYSNDPNRLLRFNQAKIYVDGILSQGTGALYAPYKAGLALPKSLERGFLYFGEDQLDAYAQSLEAIGFQLHFHATGDRATGLALNAIERAQTRNPRADRRHRVTHLYLVDQRDRARFKALGVVADFQLATASTNPAYADYMGGFIGGRVDSLLPAAALRAQGGRVVLSSDWDADALAPFEKIQAVLTRPVRAIPDLDAVIRMMTLDVAHLLHQDDKTGSLEAGKRADLIVLDQNLFEIPRTQISRTRVLLTLLDGKAIHDPGRVLGSAE